MNLDNSNQSSEERRRPEGDATNDGISQEKSACLSNTQTDSSQSQPINSNHGYHSDEEYLIQKEKEFQEPSLNVDWLEGTMCIEWSEDFDNLHVTRLYDAQREALEARGVISYQLGQYPALIHDRGIGTGNQARMTFRFTVHGMTLAFAFRDKTSRHLPNLYYKIPGEVCLYHGAEKCMEIIYDILKYLKGKILDDVVRRIDLAFDIPELNINDWIIPAFQEQKFVTSSHFWDLPDGVDGKRSIIVGKRNGVRLIIYDKRFEAEKKHDCVYMQSVIERRWNGGLPDHATRVEYQISRAWLSKFGLDRVRDILSLIPEIVNRLTQPGRGRHFVITNEKPDRKNNHQSRAGIDPRWEKIVLEMLVASGKPKEELVPIQSKSFRLERSANVIRGYLTTIAAKIGRPCDSMHDLCELLKYLGQLNEWTGQQLKEICDRKRCQMGTESLVSPEQSWDVPF